MLYKMMIMIALMTPNGPQTQVYQYNEIYPDHASCEIAAQQEVGPRTVRQMNEMVEETDLSAFGVRIRCLPLEGETSA